MKALIYYGPNNIKPEEIPTPTAQGKDVIIKVVRAGICGSDLTAYLYDGMKVGILKKGQFGHDGQFGHEMAGTVYQIGEEVTNINIGDRVFVNPTLCKRNGMLGCDIAGAFSEYMVVEDAAYGYNLFPLADDVSFDDAVLIEPLSVGTHGKNRIDVKPNENVVIYGAGTIGLCTLNALLAIGCQNPVVIDMNEKRLDLVKKMGGIPYCPTKDGSAKAFLTKLYGPVFDLFGQSKTNVDAFIDCAGAPPVINQIIDLAKNSARICIVAVYKKHAELNAAGLLSSEITIKGSCGFQLSDLVEAYNNVNHHRTKISGIITHHFKHEDAAEAFAFAADPASGAIKVVIDYE